MCEKVEIEKKNQLLQIDTRVRSTSFAIAFSNKTAMSFEIYQKIE